MGSSLVACPYGRPIQESCNETRLMRYFVVRFAMLIRPGQSILPRDAILVVHNQTKDKMKSTFSPELCVGLRLLWLHLKSKPNGQIQFDRFYIPIGSTVLTRHLAWNDRTIHRTAVSLLLVVFVVESQPPASILHLISNRNSSFQVWGWAVTVMYSCSPSPSQPTRLTRSQLHHGPRPWALGHDA